MSMTYISEFQCCRCKAIITFTDEPPPWQPSKQRAEELDYARQYVADHPTVGLFGPTPNWVGIGDFNGTTYVIEPDTRSFACPVCKDEVFIVNAVDPIGSVEVEA